MRLRALFATTTLIAATGGAAALSSTLADDPPAAPSTLSTGATETQLAPPAPPQVPMRVELPGAETQKTVEGKVRAGWPATVLFAAPVDRMLDVRLSVPPGLQAQLLVYQAGADEADPGTKAEDGAIGWIGASQRAGDLRFEVRTRSEKEIPFRVMVKIAPAMDSNG